VERYFGQFNINLVLLSAARIKYYADIELEKYGFTEFIDCVTNKKQVLDVIKGPATMFRGPAGH
jgi:IQ domain-containing protein H